MVLEKIDMLILKKQSQLKLAGKEGTSFNWSL
jgi:hypothetical protein